MKRAFALALSLFLATTALAGPSDNARPISGAADLCYHETVKVARGDIDKLSTAACNRALRSDPLTRKDRSFVLYNRGIVQQAKGDLDAARSSLERSVKLADTLDLRHVALAQVAYKQGDYSVAVRMYEMLLESPATSPDIEKRRAVIEKNLALAVSALRDDARIGDVAMNFAQP